MKFIIYRLGVFALLLLLFTTHTFANDSIQFKYNSVIKLANDNSYLYTYDKDSRVNAFMSELSDAVLTELDKGDVLSSDSSALYLTMPSDDKAKLYHFSKPIFTVNYDVVLKNGDTYNGIEDLRNKKVIIGDNLFVREYLKGLGIDSLENFIFVSDMELGLKMLSGEEGDIALSDRQFTEQIILQNNIPNLQIVQSQLPIQNISFASPNYSITLAANQALDLLMQNGDYALLYQKWYGGNQSQSYTWLFWLVVILLAVLLLSSLLYWYIKRKIRNISSKLKSSNDHLHSVNHLISLSVDESEVKIYMYDIEENQFYTLQDGDFIESYNENKEIDALIHPNDRPTFEKCIDEILHGIKNKIIYSIRLYEKEKGRYVDYEYTAVCVKDEFDHVARILYSRREEGRNKILMRRQEETIQCLESIVNAADMLRWYYDSANDTYRIVDSTSNRYTFSGSQWLDLIAQTDHSAYIHFIDNVMLSDDEPNVIETHLALPDNEVPELYKLTVIDRQSKGNETVSLSGVMTKVPSLSIEEPINNNENRYSNEIYNNIPVGIIFLDKNGVLQEVNQFFKNIMSIEKWNELIGKYRYFDLERITDEILNSVNNGTIFNYHITNTDVPHDLLALLNINIDRQNTFAVTLSAVFDDSKEIIGYTLLFNDITTDVDEKDMLNKKHQEVQYSEERLSLILNSLPIPVYITDPLKSEIVYFNGAATKLFEPKDNRYIKDFVNEKDIVLHSDIDKKVLETGEQYAANEILRLSNGKEFETFVRKVLIEFDGRKQILVMRIDLTEQRKIEMINKVLSISLPSLNAYSWYIDTRNNALRYGKVLDNTERDLNALDTMEKFVECIHVDDRDEYYNCFNSLIEKGSGESTFCFRIDIEQIGVYKWWETRGVVETVINENGEPYKLLYGIDILVDEQKRNELRLIEKRCELVRLNRQNELILNNTTMGIVYLNSNFEVQWSNIDLVFKNFGSGPCKDGMSCHLSSDEKRPCDICPLRDAAEQRMITTYQFENNDKMYGVTAIPVENNNLLEGIVLRVEDITERAKLISDLKKAKVKAEESDQLKMAFLANMSHEIRTPLNAIVGFSEMLQYVQSDDERDEFIQIIKNNNELLLGLIGDVLDLSKIESGSIDINNEPVDVIGLLNETITVAKRRSSNPNVQLKTAIPLTKCIAMTDRNRFIQICNNFLSNAYKYTKEGEIIVSLDYINNGLKLSVKDTGIGIDEDKRHLVFNRFEKFDTFAQGTGLGLAICNAIIDAIGGEIGFESTKDVGSTFWAWIPCEAEYSYVEEVEQIQFVPDETPEEVLLIENSSVIDEVSEEATVEVKEVADQPSEEKKEDETVENDNSAEPVIEKPKKRAPRKPTVKKAASKKTKKKKDVEVEEVPLQESIPQKLQPYQLNLFSFDD